MLWAQNTLSDTTKGGNQKQVDIRIDENQNRWKPEEVKIIKVENHKTWKPKQVGITIGGNQNRWKPEYMEMRRG